MVKPRVFLPNRSHFTLPKFDLNTLGWIMEMIWSKHIKERKTKGELNYWIYLGFDSFMGKVKRRSSLQSKQRKRESAKYLPLHSHNHNRGKEYTLNQFYFFFLSDNFFLSSTECLSEWVGSYFSNSFESLYEWTEGSSLSLFLHAIFHFRMTNSVVIFSNHID